MAFLNADDAFAGPDVITAVVDTFEMQRADIVFGDVEVYTNGGQLARVYRGKRFRPETMAAGLVPPHPSFYARTELLRRAGGFDTHFKIAGDFDLMLRAFRRFAPAWFYLPRTFVRMRAGGASDQGLSSYMTSSRELITACRNNGVEPNTLAIYGRALRKLVEVAEARVQRLFQKS